MKPMLEVQSLEKQFTLHLRGGLSLRVLHGVNLGPSLQIRYVGILFCELVIATGGF